MVSVSPARWTRLGVERRLLTAGENKGFLDPFSPQAPQHKAHAQQMLNDIHQQFIDVVRKTGRGKRLKETPEMFSGLMWTGRPEYSAWPGRRLWPAGFWKGVSESVLGSVRLR
jgi:hypothetical protein